jgi:hypothetical protein
VGYPHGMLLYLLVPDQYLTFLRYENPFG